MGISMHGGGGGAVAAPISLSPSEDSSYLYATPPNYGTEYGYRGKEGRWSFAMGNDVAQPGGVRGDRTWYMGYGLSDSGNGQVLHPDLAGKEELGMCIRYENYYERNAPYSTGTITAAVFDNAAGTGNGTGYTTLTGTGTTFPTYCGNGSSAIRFSNGHRYRIMGRNSGTEITVQGDATAESGTYVIYEEFIEFHMESIADAGMPYLDGRVTGNEYIRRFFNCQGVRGFPNLQVDLAADTFGVYDCYDEVMFQLTKSPYNPLVLKGLTWEVATKSLKCGTSKQFKKFVYRVGTSYITILSGTGATLGTYTINARTGDDEIRVSTNVAAGDLATGDIRAIIYSAALNSYKFRNGSVFLDNNCYIAATSGDGVAYNILGLQTSNPSVLNFGHSSLNYVSINPPAIVPGHTNGLKIGTAATDKLGFYGKTPVVRLAKASYGNWAALSNVVQALVDIGLFDAA